MLWVLRGKRYTPPIPNQPGVFVLLFRDETHRLGGGSVDDLCFDIVCPGTHQTPALGVGVLFLPYRQNNFPGGSFEILGSKIAKRAILGCGC